MAARPILDALHRGPLGRDLAAIDEEPPERAEGMPVLVRVAEAQALAVLELHLARALDLQEEGIHGVIDPDELLALDGRTFLLDVAARVVRHHAVAHELAAQALVLELGIEIG